MVSLNNDSAASGRFRTWVTLALLLICALALLAWSGAASDPRRCIPWDWSKTGWLIPSAGLIFVWISSALLFGFLCAMAFLLFREVPLDRKPRTWTTAVFILALAIAVRIAIARTWIPLPLDPLALAAKSLPASIRFHALAVLADVVVIGLLLVALHRSGRSLWWAGLYALHPLPLIEIAGNGHWIPFAMIPLVLIVVVSCRLPRWTNLAIAGLVAFSAVGIVAITASQTPFNSLAADLLVDLATTRRALLPAVAAGLEMYVLLLALRHDWPLARTLSHLLLIFLLCLPIAQPWYVLPILALAPLAWNRAGWVLSLFILSAYAAVPILRAGGSWQLPAWLVMLEWISIAVIEAQELLTVAFSSRTPHVAPSAIATPPLP